MTTRMSDAELISDEFLGRLSKAINDVLPTGLGMVLILARPEADGRGVVYRAGYRNLSEAQAAATMLVVLHQEHGFDMATLVDAMPVDLVPTPLAKA
jgi:hypothetical protein